MRLAGDGAMLGESSRNRLTLSTIAVGARRQLHGCRCSSGFDAEDRALVGVGRRPPRNVISLHSERTVFVDPSPTSERCTALGRQEHEPVTTILGVAAADPLLDDLAFVQKRLGVGEDLVSRGAR